MLPLFQSIVVVPPTAALATVDPEHSWASWFPANDPSESPMINAKVSLAVVVVVLIVVVPVPVC